ncbi:S-layer homology domain-containing protein [Bacillus sp. FJAT-26390]|uniref:S-layer homology domain-containing protein n=1 Tax=Bacillus sp. FJAT-26390 TaxID=1743142 RepID=UPI00350E3487
MINNGDAETTHGLVTLTITSTDANEYTARLSNDAAVWKAVSLADWALSNGYGEKKVYLELVDAAGNKTIVSDTIMYRSSPVLLESSVNGSEDTALHFSGDDFLYSNADGSLLDEITIDTLPANGKLQLDGSDVAANDKLAAASLAKLTFLPALNWFGQTSFEWSGSAQAIQAERSAQMIIAVAAVNDAPTVANATHSTTGSAKIEGQLAAVDVDGDAIAFAVVGQPSKGKLTLDAATGKFSFEPEAGYYENVTFTYKANDGKADSNTATVTIVNNQPASSGSGSGGSTTPLVTIEGAGNLPGVKVEVVLKDGKQVLVVSLDGKQLTELIRNVKDNELTIDVGATSHNVELAVDAALLKQLNESGKTIKLVQGGTGYGLSSSAIRDVLTDWADAGAQLKIEIKKADEADGAKIEKLAKDKGYSLLVTPMSYQLYFQNGNARIILSSVKGYITISYGQEELKGKQPKTAVLLLPNGKLVHVPTKISHNAGKFEIKVNSFANGIFTLIDYKKTFGDVGGWSKPYIEELAGRLIIQGTGDETFEPSRSVTRAEFAAIITGALGLYKEAGVKSFSDVSEDSWYAASLAAATEYGLISGYADGSFRPNEKISREEAMVILARSFSLMELKPGFTQAELDQGLASFGDKDELKSWSQASVRLTVLLGIVNGSNDQLLPAEPMTREQLAAVIVKLLQAGQFI